MSRRPARLIPLAALALAGCGSSLPPPQFERFDVRTTPAPSDYPDAPAVVLLDRGELVLTVDPRTGNPIARLRRLRRVKILRESGLELARVVAAYEPGSAIRGLSARAVAPSGEETIADRENIADSPYAGEVRAKTLFVPNAGIGAVVEATWDQYFEDPRFLAPWQFAGPLPTKRSELAVVVPPGFTVDLRFSEGGRFVDRPPERFDTPRGTRFSWSRADLPPIYEEPRMPAPALLAPRAHVVYLGAKIRGRAYEGFGSWDQVAGWFVSRVPNWAELSEANRGEAARVAGDAPELEKAVKIMEVLARDLPDEPGPTPPLWRAPLFHPNTVLSKGSANPTSRGLLFVSLLRAVGLDAVPGLFVYADQDVILPDLPTVRALGGVCAVLPRAEGPIVLDPSQPLVDPRVPAPRLQGTRLVALMPDGAQVLRVPYARPEDSLTEVRYDLRLDPRGDLFGPLKATLTGAEAGALREQLLALAPERYAEAVGEFLAARGVPFEVESVSIADLTALRRPLGIRASINRPGFLDSEGVDVPIALARIIGSPQDPPPQVRRAPLLLPPPSKVEIRATVTLPDEYAYEGLPEPAALTWLGGRLELAARGETRRRVGFLRSELRTERALSPEQYRAFRRHREAVVIAEDASFLVRRPPPRSLEY